MSNEIPRRARMDMWTPAEKAIQEAVDRVEEMGAHPKLTDIVVMLGRARELVADYVDERPGEFAPDAHERCGTCGGCGLVRPRQSPGRYEACPDCDGMKVGGPPTPPSAPTGAPAFKLCARCGKSTGLAASAEGRRHCSMECATADADEQTAAGLDADLDDARQARRFARDYEPAPSAPREGAARGEGADYERGRADRERELLAEAKAFGDERGRSAASTGGMLKQRRLGAADAMWWFVRCVQEGKSLMDRDGVTLAHVDDEDYEPTPSPAPTPPPGEGEVSHVHGCDCPECVEWRQEQRDSAPTPSGPRELLPGRCECGHLRSFHRGNSGNCGACECDAYDAEPPATPGGPRDDEGKR